MLQTEPIEMPFGGWFGGGADSSGPKEAYIGWGSRSDESFGDAAFRQNSLSTCSSWSEAGAWTVNEPCERRSPMLRWSGIVWSFVRRRRLSRIQLPTTAQPICVARGRTPRRTPPGTLVRLRPSAPPRRGTSVGGEARWERRNRCAPRGRGRSAAGRWGWTAGPGPLPGQRSGPCRRPRTSERPRQPSDSAVELSAQPATENCRRSDWRSSTGEMTVGAGWRRNPIVAETDYTRSGSYMTTEATYLQTQHRSL